ncbi:MAG: 3-hydroxybenzoate 4-monooxygenase, partial [Leifsonia flava]
GRWRLYAFADSPAAGEPSALESWAEWISSSAESPVVRYTSPDQDIDAVFDVKVIYQQRFDEIDISRVPAAFRPQTGPLGLTDWEKVFAAAPSAWTTTDIYDERGLARDGVVVVVRPDQYVAAVLPLSATDALAEFFTHSMVQAR